MNKQNVYDNYNWTLFKLSSLYQLVDPDSKKIFGYNVYSLVNIILIIFTTIVMILGLSGYFYEAHNDTDNKSDDGTMFIIFFTVMSTVANFKTIIIIYNARKLWSVLEITRESFLSNRFYKRNYYKIVNCGRLLTKLFVSYMCFVSITAMLYASAPIILNTRPVDGTAQQNTGTIRKTNVIDLRYPFTAETYNAFFMLFYAAECVMLFYAGFGSIALDLFSITVLMVMSVQYKLIASAFEVLERRVDNEHDSFLSDVEFLEQLMSIVSDSQILHKKLKMFYDIIRPVGLIQMIADASGMISMPYLILIYFQKYGTLFNPETLKLVLTLGFVGMQSYVYCSLFQLVTDRRDAVNFGLYCSDWTGIDIRMKKLILLVMRINNSNKLKMNLTPNDSIDQPLLSNIIRLSYRVVSVMINKNINNLKHLQ